MTVTRFAPSPTGFMHIGNLRTALYAYLLARADKENGTFILRIEDTDRERMVEGAFEVILKTLADTGLSYDEGPGKDGGHGPYIQSDRLPIYQEYAKKLVDMGNAYYCFCTKERLESLHEADENGGYDRHCRDLSKEEVEGLLASGTPHVIRQKMPLEGRTSFVDEVYGEIGVDNTELQDQILLKADGYPTYNFAHVVDDYLMGVTHVVRGSEYLSSTPKYALLYDSFGWERPHYVHLPLIMGKNDDGSVSKLSKRHGAVSFHDLKNDGYLPEAVVNYIALLGWSPKTTTQEIFTMEELSALFSVEGINKSAPIFDYDKLLWMNGKYLKAMTPEEFAARSEEFQPEALKSHPRQAKILSLVQGRVDKLSQIAGLVDFFFTLPEYDKEIFVNKKNKTNWDNIPGYLAAVKDALLAVDDFINDNLYAALVQKAEELGVKSGALLWVARSAVSGLPVTPGGATEIMEILGKEETMNRIEKAFEKMN